MANIHGTVVPERVAQQVLQATGVAFPLTSANYQLFLRSAGRSMPRREAIARWRRLVRSLERAKRRSRAGGRGSSGGYPCDVPGGKLYFHG